MSSELQHFSYGALLVGIYIYIYIGQRRYSRIHCSIQAIVTAVVVYGITKIHSLYKITKTWSAVEAYSLWNILLVYVQETW